MSDFDSISEPSGTIDWDAISQGTEKPKPAPPERKPTHFLKRVLQGLADPGMAAGQLMDVAIDPWRQFFFPGAANMNDVIRERDKNYVPPEGADFARMGGNVANPLTWAGGGAAADATLVAPAVARALPATLAKTGAAQAMLAPTDADLSPGEFAVRKGIQGVTGAVLGKTLDKVTGGALSPDAQALYRHGVDLTPGQAAGGSMNRREQKLTSLPFAGDVIHRARRRAGEDVLEQTVERATGTPGLRTVADANTAVSNTYNRSVPSLWPNPEGITEAANAYNRALQNPLLNADQRATLTALWDRHFANYAQLDGEGLKALDSEFGYLARQFGSSKEPASRAMADELRNITMALRGGLEQGVTGADAANLRAANSAFRQMVPVNKAASARTDGVVTPGRLLRENARQAHTDLSRMPEDPLLSPANRLMGDIVPDSGSAGRIAEMNFFPSVLGAAAWIPTAMAYSRPGVRLLAGQTDWQQAMEPAMDPLTRSLIAALRE